MVFVAEHIRERAASASAGRATTAVARDPQLGGPRSLDRPKLPGAEFTLGVVGFVPAFKRLDRVLDIVERLRAVDERFRLRCKGHMPWELPGLLNRPDDRTFFEAVFDRIRRSPLLRDAVLSSPSGTTSTLPRGGGLDPVHQRRRGARGGPRRRHGGPLRTGRASTGPGARAQYGDRWVHPDSTSAADWVLGHAGPR